MDKPNHHDVDVILKLYELRREDRMRKARAWLFGYKASNAAEHQTACPPGSDQEAYFRMVTTYWDMAASFVTSGAVNKDLFLQSAGELLFVWEKTKGTIADMRKAAGNPSICSNLETVAQALIENMNKANPKAYEAYSTRIRGAGA
jgi:L-rhamnose mutarotase